MLFQVRNEIQIQWKRDKDWGNVLYVTDASIPIDQLLSCFIDVLVVHRLNRMIKKIAHDHYYYTDADEIERICQLTNWVLREAHYATFLFKKEQSLHAFLHTLLEKHMESEKSIYFDSLVTFNLKPFNECLKMAVGFGIDEMKREEEYQSFIQSTREYILRRKTKVDKLYVVQGDSFTFYKPNGKPYSPVELRTLMYREPLYLLGLDENEMNLSPVLTLLPRQIYIYGDHPSEPKTLTLINLFEEKVQFFPKAEFPFHSKVK